MTTHELANILLQQEDVPVHFQYFHDELECNLTAPVGDARFYNGAVYLAESRFVSPEEEEAAKEEEWRQIEEERLAEELRKANVLTLGKILSLTSIETQDAFRLFNEDFHDDRLSHEIAPEGLTRLLSSYFVSNARLTEKCMLEVLHVVNDLGFYINPELFEYVEKYAEKNRYNTEREYLKAMRELRKNK